MTDALVQISRQEGVRALYAGYDSQKNLKSLRSHLDKSSL